MSVSRSDKLKEGVSFICSILTYPAIYAIHLHVEFQKNYTETCYNEAMKKAGLSKETISQINKQYYKYDDLDSREHIPREGPKKLYYQSFITLWAGFGLTALFIYGMFYRDVLY